MDELIEAARDIKATAVGKMQRFIRRELGWQNQTLAWQKLSPTRRATWKRSS